MAFIIAWSWSSLLSRYSDWRAFSTHSGGFHPIIAGWWNKQAQATQHKLAVNPTSLVSLWRKYVQIWLEWTEDSWQLLYVLSIIFLTQIYFVCDNWPNEALNTCICSIRSFQQKKTNNPSNRQSLGFINMRIALFPVNFTTSNRQSFLFGCSRIGVDPRFSTTTNVKKTNLRLQTWIHRPQTTRPFRPKHQGIWLMATWKTHLKKVLKP